ncbi:MAG: carbohydrate porin [Paludibacter sp.]|nr:carbohydrate porin [Paludibacter sp.]
MKLIYKLSITGLFTTIWLCSIQAQVDSNAKESSFKFQASYIGDLVSNFSGGIKTGTTYLGLANLKAGFNTEKANWWKGGQVFVNVGNTHGGEPSTTLVGDFQGVSNIEAGNLTFMYELWFKQNIGKFEITLGLQDLNSDFAVSENGALFTNSSFGIHSSLADNISVPIFPLTALGANIHYNISDTYTWEAAIFDGTPDDFEKNPYNLNWKLSKEQGYLLVTEFRSNKTLIKGKNGIYKFGAYYHQHNDSIDNQQRNGGLYLVADQQITDKLSLFTQIGYSPKKLNYNNKYFSIGFNYKGLFNKRPADQFGLAMNYASIESSNIGSETAFEMTYKYELCEHIYLRPDIQYIINPAGTNSKLKNALVGFLRFGIDF